MLKTDMKDTKRTKMWSLPLDDLQSSEESVYMHCGRHKSKMAPKIPVSGVHTPSPN